MALTGMGYTRATMVKYKGLLSLRGVCESHKVCRSPDRSLQLDSVKLESLVIVDQNCHGEYVPGPCTHRPSHHGSGLHQKSGSLNLSGMDDDHGVAS